MIEMARTLAAEGILVELIGAADADVRDALRAAQREVRALVRVRPERPGAADRRGRHGRAGAAARQANYRHSMPTKVVEYMARGIPVITTPNP